MKWSKIQNTELAMKAKEHIVSNALAYHNWDHVCSMYDYLELTDEPYNEALDWAVLYHDIIYDIYPDKEYRSALLFHYDAQGILDKKLIFDAGWMILATEKHLVIDPKLSAIIRADLHALASPVNTIRNYVKIMDESMILYDINEYTFAENNINFMQNLRLTIMKNIENDPDHSTFYEYILEGIDLTITLSEKIIGKYQ